jgi:hypothetical protein
MQALMRLQRYPEDLPGFTQWVGQQRAANMFVGQVVGPLALELHVRNPAYAHYLENVSVGCACVWARGCTCGTLHAPPCSV